MAMTNQKGVGKGLANGAGEQRQAFLDQHTTVILKGQQWNNWKGSTRNLTSTHVLKALHKN